MGDLTLSTTAYQSSEDASRAGEESEVMPARYASSQFPGGQNVSIPFEWSGVPSGTKSLALVVVDLAPVAHEWMHWVVVGISADTTGVPEGASRTPDMPQGAEELDSTSGTEGYSGPNPPAGSGLHPYQATLYALDVERASLPAAPSHSEFQRAVSGHVLASATYTGLLGR